MPYGVTAMSTILLTQHMTVLTKGYAIAIDDYESCRYDNVEDSNFRKIKEGKVITSTVK
jgi:hypothetical protein